MIRPKKWLLCLFHPIAKSITLIHRRDKFRAHEATVEQVKKLGIPLITESEVTNVAGTLPAFNLTPSISYQIKEFRIISGAWQYTADIP